MWELVQLALTSEPVDSVRQDDGTDIFGCGSSIGVGYQEGKKTFYGVMSPRLIFLKVWLWVSLYRL